MSEEKSTIEVEKPLVEETTNKVQENTSEDGEFKITVRKLEMPVRPRGVLAE